MFTGLVEGTAEVLEARLGGREGEMALELGALAEGVGVGDSVAVSGCCLTVAALAGTAGRFLLSEETLSRTWFPRLRRGDRVNIERPLRLSDRLGGHLVQGHVDGLAVVETPYAPPSAGEEEAGGAASGLFHVRLQRRHLRYVVEKGSLALDGVSLTVATLEGEVAGIALIPHTAAVTTLGGRRGGDPLHVEVDVLAKYVERLLAAHLPPTGGPGGGPAPAG